MRTLARDGEKVFKKFAVIFAGCEKILVAISTLMLLSMVLMVVANSFMRYYLAKPIPWVTQFSEYFILAITFFVASWLMKNDEHVTSEILINYLSPRYLRFVNIIRYSISFIVCVLLFYYSLLSVIDNFQRGVVSFEYIKMPRYLPISSIAIGTFFLCVRCLEKVIKQFTLKIEREISRNSCELHSMNQDIGE